MLRSMRLALGFVAVLAAAGEARAQFGYGYYPYGYASYGWGGWGQNPQGSIARGLGYYATGLGNLEVADAQATAINTNAEMQWDQFMYNSQLTANRNAQLRSRERMLRDIKAGDALNKQAPAAPGNADIANGNALNAALDQITDPRVHTSALRLATAKVPGRVIRAIPFANASEAVTISLDQLTAENGWPVALRAPEFRDERVAYSAAVDQALKQVQDGDISPQTVQQMRAALSRLKAKLDAVPPADRARFGEAETYLKSLYAMTRMLERPDYEKIIAELDSIKETTLGSLLGFMLTFNLRFGRPTTPEQTASYRELYPILAAHRDRVMKDAGLIDTTKSDATSTAHASDTARTSDFFRAMRIERLDGPHRYQPKPDNK
jgi:hypothetical protein